MSAPRISPQPPFTEEAARARKVQRDWAGRAVRERLRPVRSLRHLLAERADELCAAADRDLGKPPGELIVSDLLPTADACRYLEKNAARLLRPRRESWTNRPFWLWRLRDTVYRRPHGVVGVIGTWNYPVLLNGVQIVQALTAGNAVLWKPSEVVPATSQALHGLFLEAGFPADLVQRLPATREAGPLVAEAEVDHVVFTGSATVGRKLAARLGERLVSSTLELSGCDAMFVLADADIRLAARAAWFGATVNRGQTCIAVRRTFVDRRRYDEFLAALAPLAAAAKPMPQAVESQVRQAERLVNDAVAAGAKLLNPVSFPAAGSLCPPAVLMDVRPEMALCREAPFAPVVGVLPFDTEEDALRQNAGCPFGLGASVFTADQQAAERWAERLAVGMVAVNDVVVPTLHPATPFGGRGAAGWGVTQGAEGLLAMTVPQAVSVRGGDWRPHYHLARGATRADEELFRGLLELGHGASAGRRWRGLRRILRNGWQWVRKD